MYMLLNTISEQSEDKSFYVLGVKKMELSYLYIKLNLEMHFELISHGYLAEGERRGQTQLQLNVELPTCSTDVAWPVQFHLFDRDNLDVYS